MFSGIEEVNPEEAGLQRMLYFYGKQNLSQIVVVEDGMIGLIAFYKGFNRERPLRGAVTPLSAVI